MADNFLEIWQSLGTSPPHGGYVQRGIYTDAKIDLYLGLESSGIRFLIFAARKSAISQVRTPVSSDGLDIRKLERTDYGEEKLVYRVALTDSTHEDLFDKFVHDICSRAKAHDTENSAYVALIVRIGEWQQFFAKNSFNGLNPEARRGLYGELSFLRELANEGILAVSGLGCWRGPFLSDQDYQFPLIAVEVKVSIGAQNQELVVSSERQLDDANYKKLFVYHMALSIRRNSGETLNDIVDSIRALLPSVMSEDFERGLFQAGYTDAHRDLYADDGYAVRETNYFEVTEGFPRITETELQRKTPGVGKVRYSISVPVCKGFSVPREEVLESLRGSYG